MLGKVMPIGLQYHIYEGDSEENRELVTSGEWRAG
jgi:hypothetical protein